MIIDDSGHHLLKKDYLKKIYLLTARTIGTSLPTDRVLPGNFIYDSKVPNSSKYEEENIKLYCGNVI